MFEGIKAARIGRVNILGGQCTDVILTLLLLHRHLLIHSRQMRVYESEIFWQPHKIGV